MDPREALPIIDGRFELLRLVGEGGMGKVYAARDRLLDATVAVKVLTPAFESDVRRFVREGEVLAELLGPGIVQYIAHGATARGQPYIAMEWLEGETLQQRLGRDHLNERDAITLGIHVADALVTGHAKGVIHRDIKPSNLFLQNAEIARVKVIDFGIARQGTRSNDELTLTGMVLGTPGYMAPEAMRDARSVDARVDIYALGAVLFRALTGKLPFNADDALRFMTQSALVDAPRLSTVVPDVSPALEDLIASMLARSPTERPRTAGDVARALRKLEARTAGGPPTPAPSLPRPEGLSIAPKARGLSIAPKARGLSIAPKARGLTTDEQRTFSLVMAAAAMHAGRGPSIRVIREAVARYGGVVEHALAGSVSVSVARTGTAADQAVRAVECALALLAVIGDAKVVVVTGKAEASGTVPVGPTVDRGAKMIHAHEGGGVQIDELTAGLVGDAFAVSWDRNVAKVVGTRVRAAAPRTLLGHATPCVGRDGELDALTALASECATGRVSRAAIVVGSAGIGKSRVGAELVARLEYYKFASWVAHGDALSAGVPFGMIAQAVREGIGLPSGLVGAAANRWFHARVGQHLGAIDAMRAAEFIGEITGMPTDTPTVQLQAARQDARLMSDQIRRVWELWMRAETEQQPLLLLLDDLQWGDLPSVQLVFDMLARRSDMPILVVAFARPEVRDTFPQVFAKGVVEIELGELSKTACEAIVRGVLGDVPSDVITQLAMRSTGNALFLEELLRHEGEGGSVPETLLALVESRVQEQPPEARRVLRAASILGRVFWTRGVDVLLGGEPSAECLETLADREIVTRQQDSRHQNSAEYTFRHALVRDAAYAMLTEEDRRLGHALAAKWLDEEGADEFVVARHLELAGDKQGAALKHARAAERLLDGNDLVAARSLVERTLASLTDDGSPSAREARLSLLRVLYESSLWQGDIPAAVQAAKLWVPRARPGSCEWYDAISRAATSHGRAGDRVGVAEVAALLVESTPDADAIDAFAIALAHSGSSLVLEGDYERTNAVRAKLDEVFASRTPSLLALSWVAQFRAMEAVRRALPEKSFLSFLDGARSFEAMEDVRNFSVQLSNVAHAANELGDYDAAEDYAVQSLALADEHGFVTFARQHLARAMARTGRRAAHAEFERVVREFNRHHLPRQEAMALGFHAEACLREGALVLAESHARRAMDLSPSPSSHRRASAVLARTLLATGRNEEALEVARVAMHAVRTSTRVDLGDALVRLAFVETSRAAGHEDDARQTLAESRVLLEERLRNIESPEWRIMYAHVEENARLLELSNE